MTWLHFHDLLDAQIKRDFPNGDVRPFATEVRAAKSWPEIEKLFRAHEAATRDEVERAMLKFIHTGHWPKLDARAAMWVNARLRAGRWLALRLIVPIRPDSRNTAADFTAEDILEWLLMHQWDAVGLGDWLADFHQTYRLCSKPRRSKTDDWFLPPNFGRGGQPPPTNN